MALVLAWGAGAEWVAAPDIVAGGLASLERSLAWLPWLLSICRRVLIPVQDGMEPADVAPFLSRRVGIFLGGSTDEDDPFGGWKLRTMAAWGCLARSRGCYFHVGRVNTARRIKMCGLSGADSFDGTKAVRFGYARALIDNARRQTAWRL